MAFKNIFVFPGQGAQVPGMAKDLCESYKSAKDCLEKISRTADKDIAGLLWNSTQEELSRSDNSQLAITAHSLILIEVLKEKGISPCAVAGFSLGEWPALYAAGVLSFEDLIFAVKRRGEIMQSVCDEIAAENQGKAPGMAAVLGLSEEQVKELIKGRNDVFAVNMNSPVQTVVSGTAVGLSECERICKEAGAKRVVMLKVAGPFHSILMQKAADQFEKVLENITFNNPSLTIFSNVSGKEMTTGQEAKENAVRHIISPVLWTTEEKHFASMMASDENSQWRLLEVGPGSVLSGLWAKSGVNSDIQCFPCGTMELISKI